MKKNAIVPGGIFLGGGRNRHFAVLHTYDENTISTIISSNTFSGCASPKSGKREGRPCLMDEIIELG